MKWQLDMLADHSIHFYIEHIARAVKQEQAAMRKGGEATEEEDIVISHTDEAA
jgi:hypothetical protein